MKDLTGYRKCLYCDAVFSIRGKGQHRRIQCGSAECQLKHRYGRENRDRPSVAGRDCLECGTRFTAKTNTQCCSEDCRNERKKRRARKHAAANFVAGTKRNSYAEKACQRDDCSETFKPYTKRSRYCSRLCAQRANDAEKVRRRQSQPRLCHKCNVVDVGWGKPGKPVCDGCKVENRDPVAARANEQARRFRTYGITENEYNAILERQGGRCGICRTDDPGAKGWAIDHCHESELVRGVLCGRCNSGIGLLRDDHRVIAAAAEYVKRNRQLQLIAN